MAMDSKKELVLVPSCKTPPYLDTG